MNGIQDDRNTKLTIGIPTYNRPLALIELLKCLYSLSVSENYFNILILDNSENDITEVQLFEAEYLNKVNLKYIKHDQNIGFDNNILQLYLNTSTDYLWLIGDDDLPEDNCLIYIFKALSSNPDIVLIPFRQPSSLILPNYQNDPFEIIHDNAIVASLLISKTGKISSFLYKINQFDTSSIARLKSYSESGWMHMALAYENLFLNPNFKLKTLNIFGAKSKSDNDVKNLQWIPLAYLKFDLLKNHPFIKPIFSNKKIKKNWRNIYYGGIWLTCMGASKAWHVELISQYKDFGKKYPFNNYLFRNPIFLLYWILLKLNLTQYFKVYFSFLSKRAGYQ
jgi:glycosyltransferase involved in cell wall biosynthesis